MPTQPEPTRPPARDFGPRPSEPCAGPNAPTRARQRTDQAVFGIVQGGTDSAVRRANAQGIAALGFEGYAHGGLGLGEEPTQRADLVAATNEVLPAASPRYLMGIGYPPDLVDAISAGIDLFDCVIPTRHARHGVLFTREGVLKLRNAQFKQDAAPPDAELRLCDLRAALSRLHSPPAAGQRHTRRAPGLGPQPPLLPSAHGRGAGPQFEPEPSARCARGSAGCPSDSAPVGNLHPTIEDFAAEFAKSHGSKPSSCPVGDADSPP